MPLLQGLVIAPSNTSNADASNPVALMGKAAELIVAQLHGKYYTQAYRSNLFNGTTAVGGVAVALVTTTSQTFGLWNPAGNTKNAVLTSLDIGLVSGTIIVSNFTLGQNLNAGAQVVTGGISAFTAGTPQGGNVALSGGNTVRFCPATATTPAPTFLMTLGVSFVTSETTLNYAYTGHYEFDGKVVVPPNAAVWVSNNVASGATADLSLFWEEVPI